MTSKSFLKWVNGHSLLYLAHANKYWTAKIKNYVFFIGYLDGKYWAEIWTKGKSTQALEIGKPSDSFDKTESQIIKFIKDMHEIYEAEEKE